MPDSGDPSRCPHCGAPLETRVQAGGEATAGGVTALVERLRRRVCPEGHHVRAPSADQRDRLRTAALDRLPSASRGLLRSQDRCEVCGGKLTMPPRRTRRTVTLDDPALGVVTVTFELALTRCAGCGHDQAARGVARDAATALQAALAPTSAD